MYDIIYDYLSGSNMLGSAMSYESIQILCRYMAVGLTFAIFFGIIYLLCKFFEIIIRAFRG